ncbi:MAG: PD-(D/E)XK nuclease family transposase [Treponema sp.]|nr:PD-(D/E)XK nuclease family transposase [Treponema sp.]
MKNVCFPDNAVILSPCIDAVFKLVFTRETPSSRGALAGLASAFIGRKTQVLAVTANEPPVNSLRDRQIRFDIACKLEGGEQANLEMTLHPKSYEAARLEYYLARLYANQDIKGADKTFDGLRRAYQISFFAKENLYADGELIHRFRYYDKRHGLYLGGRTEIITIELRKAAGLEEKPVREMSPGELWAFFFRYGPDAVRRERINEIMGIEEGIAMAGEELLTVSEDEQLQAWLRSAEKYMQEKYELDRHSEMVYARREGRAQGLAEGRTEGLAEGRAEGYKEAKAEDQEQIRRLEEEIRRLRGE